MFCIYVERCFESLICWLDLWLSSHLVAFSSYVFFSLEKPLFCILDSFSIESWQLPLLSRFLGFTSTISQQIGQSIEPKSCAICLLDTSLTDSQSIEVGFYSIAARQFLDLLRPSCMQCFSHVFVSFYYFIIHSILFHYIHSFLWIPFAPLITFDHFYVSRVKFFSFLYPLSIMTKREGKCGFFLRFDMLGGEIHTFVRGSCVSSC